MSNEIRPQPRQEEFLKTPADICVYGGSAGGGKTWSLLAEPLRHVNNPGFRCTIFRRTMPQVTNAGGLFDASKQIYPLFGAIKRQNPRPHWIFPSGAIIYFAHLQYTDTVLDWQGTELSLIEFDELTHFEESQFWYMMSRNRSTCGVRPYIRASTNPDPDSFVKKLMGWWLDEKTGLAIPERSGVIRYMVRITGEVMWGDTKQELIDRFGCKENEIKSFTFVMSSVYDNKILLDANPEYMANLKALPIVDQERLLNGNWNIRPASGLYFRRSRVGIVDEIPNDVVRWVRAWDFASKAERKDGDNEGYDFTSGVLIGKRKCGRFVIADVINQRLAPSGVEQTVLNTAKSDKAKYRNVKIRLSIDPGQAGIMQNEYYIKKLAGFSVVSRRETGDKITRAEPLSSQWMGQESNQFGNVDVLAAPWNEQYFSQLESFPDAKHDDMVDASANAFNELMSGATSFGLNSSAAEADRNTPWRI